MFLEEVAKESTALGHFVEIFEQYVGDIALLLALVIEIFGIIVIIVGVVKAFVCHLSNMATKSEKYNIVISLGKALSLGLEFKMGAEILKTVVVREIQDLLILGAIILLRAILAVLIHWEIKNEKKDAFAEESAGFGFKEMFHKEDKKKKEEKQEG